MRVHPIACAAICIVMAGCSAELAERPAASDPGSAAAAEAPYRPPPAYEPDPLLSAAPAKSAEPPGNPPMREEPGGHMHHHPGGEQ
jgi:hypothetical protein